MSKKQWALILGGSSGIGLASAQKLASEGYNIFVVHRDRRGSMQKVESEFEKIRAAGVKFKNFNVNALSADGRAQVVNGIADEIGTEKISLMLHSIALGNLKLIAPLKKETSSTVTNLASRLGIAEEDLQKNIDELFDDGNDDLVSLCKKPAYDSDMLCGEEDVAQTIYNMGTSILSWVQDVFARNMFAPDSRVLGLTSEGNEIAWRGYAAVAAAKCALESVSRAIAVEFAPHGIKSNILQPGITDTPALRLIPGSAHMKAAAVRRNPHGRITTPEDVANVVSLMARPEAAWINGTIIRVDGGEHISG